ncbi:MAG: hypothetical protein HYV63_24480 [Candidatus Schekmanbacteria bacterium]|nr:hypothetical protein [Candidatus Schekmanbacteria bacterium]
MHAIYSALVWTVVWGVLVPVAWCRAALGADRRALLDQRLGRCLPPPGGPGRIAIHAVSVGELRAAEALIVAVRAQNPALAIVLTTGNRDALSLAELIRRRQPTVLWTSLLPWDRRRATERWVRNLGVGVLVVIETEIWPNLFRACRRNGVPLLVASGRIYPRDVGRYRLLRCFFARVLADVSWIAARTAADADRFVAIGAAADRVEVAGDLKCDFVPPGPGQEELAVPDDRRPVLVGACLRGAEQRVLVDTWKRLRPAVPELRLILAPRHLGAVRSTARGLRQNRVRVALLSDNTTGRHAPAAGGPDCTWDVLLVDRIGTLPELYRFGQVVVIGGSLVSRGGHNPLEAVRCGCAVVVGPHVDNFRELVATLERAGGLVRANRKNLDQVLLSLFADPERRSLVASRGAAAVGQLSGPARRVAAELLARLDSSRVSVLAP